MSDTVFYTDMISEAAEYAGFPYGVTAQTKNLYGGIIKSKVVIETAEQEKMLGKKRGIYYTFDNQSDKKDAKRDKILIEEMAAVFVRLAAKAVKGRPEILVVGLGNRDIRADALGIEVINRLIITRPYFEENSLLARGARTELSAIAPGVYGLTGIQSGDIVKAVAEKVRPNLVIAVDSLAAARVSRLYSSYQITTAGIQPGSGISSGKKYIDFQSLGVPVISVGVPLALYAASLLREGIVNFIKLSDRRTAEYDINSALEETLTQKFSAMVVAPKQIEDIVENCAEIIAASVNLAFQGKTQKERIF
ncbi:MAG TPA: GPR endopeptidase [Candidatus Faecicola pullistercoris]|nr:GPR endopeptidase [Candidatus Faecicola pullistercoris]